MTKNTKGFLVVLAVVASAYVAYRLSHPSKSIQVSYLIKNNYTTGSPAQLMGMGDDYILAWYKAARKQGTSFELGGKQYNTKGGQAI
jgi:hypothetical protein